MSDDFEPLRDVYEASINWPKRLAHETPFFRGVFESQKVHTVLDAACGTGQHAALFRQWGLQVQGADISAGMIERARGQFGEQEDLRWVVRGYEEAVPEAFDAVVCVGNSLALARDAATVRVALASLMTAARRCLVVHVLNLWALPEGPAVWQKCVRADVGGKPALIIKGVHRCGGQGYIEVLVSTLEDPPKLHSRSMAFLGIEAAEVEWTLRAAGAREVAVYGGYQKQPYERASSVDLMVVAER
jgi:SAM-dependent methyltransferase